jgi:hypothetical protein
MKGTSFTLKMEIAGSFETLLDRQINLLPLYLIVFRRLLLTPF